MLLGKVIYANPVECFIQYPIEKIRPADFPVPKQKEVIYAAGNEWEACQIGLFNSGKNPLIIKSLDVRSPDGNWIPFEVYGKQAVRI